MKFPNVEYNFFIQCKCGGEQEFGSNEGWEQEVCIVPGCRTMGCFTLADDQCPKCGSPDIGTVPAQGIEEGATQCQNCGWDSENEQGRVS